MLHWSMENPKSKSDLKLINMKSLMLATVAFNFSFIFVAYKFINKVHQAFIIYKSTYYFF
jgi:hypothetical protein